MPILIKDYDWKQTESRILITVQNIRWTKHSSYDLSDQYFKSNYATGHILEFFFEKKIDVPKSRMTINGDQLLLDLCKANNGEVWKSVDLSGSLSREDKIDLRLKSQEWISEYSKNLCTRKSEDSSRLERKSIEKAIQRDEDSQRKLECQKNRIKDEFISSNTKTPLKNHINTNTPSRVNEVKCHDTSLLVKLAMEKDRILPVVRSPGCIMVTFTPRSAPTPLRENKKENEGEWLRKKWEAFSRAEGIQVSEINEDLDPTQILGKGNYLMSTEDILSAVSIYTHGIKLFPKMAAMYNNRSVAYIKIKNYEEALHDIHMALKFLLPPVNDNLNQRTKSTMRKSYILFKLDRIKDAINELDVASKLMPDNVEIASYLESLKELSDEDESLDESD